MSDEQPNTQQKYRTPFVLETAPPFTSADAVATLIAADGNKYLAAERLGTTDAVLLTTIISDPASFDTLNRFVRFRTIIQTFEALTRTHERYLATLDDLDVRDLARAYNSLLLAITQLTQSTVQTHDHRLNASDQVLRMLPQNIREAVLALSPQTPNMHAPSPQAPDA